MSVAAFPDINLLQRILPARADTLEPPLYERIAAAMKLAAKDLNVMIVWGGDWRTLKDGPHFELDRKAYPPV